MSNKIHINFDICISTLKKYLPHPCNSSERYSYTYQLKVLPHSAHVDVLIYSMA
jgi:hypothetical protein